MGWRLPISLITAVVITLGLFFLMHKLIELGKVELNKDQGVRISDFVRLRKESKTQTKKRQLPQRRKVQSQPTPPSLKMPKSSLGSGSLQAVKIAAPPPTVQKRVRLVGGPSLGSAPSDAGSVPLVRIQPMYPRDAAQRRIEGWVLLEFTISTTGSVKRARVIKSQPRRVFDKSALRAIRKWKYKPKIVNGKAVETKGVQVRLTFELDN